jgi:hypothetical protein
MALTLTNIINLFTSPAEVFQTIKNKPKWVLVFTVVVAAYAFCGFCLRPYSQKIMIETLSAKLSDDQLRQAISLSERFQYIGLMFVPIPFFVKGLFVSAFLYFGAVLINAQQLQFKTVFAVVVYAELILVFMSILNILLLQLKGVDSVHTVLDLQAIIGLDCFLADKPRHMALFTLFNSFNVFSVWYVVTLSTGMSVVGALVKWKSVTLVSSVWLLGVAVQVVFSMVSSGMQLMPE